MYAQNKWQIKDPNGIIYPWYTHPFLHILEKWDLENMTWLEFGAGYSTIWLRSRCKYVDSIETDKEWIISVEEECQKNNFENGKIHDLESWDTSEEYLDAVPKNITYDIITVDGIWRDECMIWSLNHLRRNGGILIADNWQQDYVWVNQATEILMNSYKINSFIQPNHRNHMGKPWQTAYWEIDKKIKKLV